MERTDDIEKLHMKFCKIFLGVHSKASNLAVYSELGRYPLVIDQVIQCLKYLEAILNTILIMNFSRNSLKIYN